MQLERKALYTLLRMNWLHDPTLEVQPWQVENYRDWNADDLLNVVQEFGGPANKSQFLELAFGFDDPEHMTHAIVGDEVDPELEDQLYLPLFELWRRWMPESPSLSIFCDELDVRIGRYDLDEDQSAEAMPDYVSSLLDLLDESADEGGEPQEVFAQVSAHCANDLGSFLFDYIADQIEGGRLRYAQELIEGFDPYLANDRWFEFLRAQLLAESDIDQANQMLQVIVSQGPPDLELNLEMLVFLSQSGDRDLFVELANKTLSLLEREEDLLELLDSVAQYYRCLDCDELEKRVNALIEERSHYTPETKIKAKETVLKTVRTLLAARH